MRGFLTAGLFLATIGPAVGQTLDKTITIGSLGDQSGIYSDVGGPGATLAAQMAVEDSGNMADAFLGHPPIPSTPRTFLLICCRRRVRTRR